MKTIDFLEEEVKRTVGYNEARYKAEFMVGAQVALNKAEAHYLEIITSLEARLKISEANYKYVSDDIKTLTGIISKYTS